MEEELQAVPPLPLEESSCKQKAGQPLKQDVFSAAGSLLRPGGRGQRSGSLGLVTGSERRWCEPSSLHVT